MTGSSRRVRSRKPCVCGPFAVICQRTIVLLHICRPVLMSKCPCPSGFVFQLAEAFGATDVTETLSIAGTLASLDEYWSSELCFKMVSRGRTVEKSLRLLALAATPHG